MPPTLALWLTISTLPALLALTLSLSPEHESKGKCKIFSVSALLFYSFSLTSFWKLRDLHLSACSGSFTASSNAVVEAISRQVEMNFWVSEYIFQRKQWRWVCFTYFLSDKTLDWFFTRVERFFTRGRNYSDDFVWKLLSYFSFWLHFLITLVVTAVCFEWMSCFTGFDGNILCVFVAGIAYLGGVCSAKRKCVLAEDNGLNLAFTIAHELGHKWELVLLFLSLLMPLQDTFI